MPDTQEQILEELKKLNARFDRLEKEIRNVRFNSSHPLLKLLFR